MAEATRMSLYSFASYFEFAESPLDAEPMVKRVAARVAFLGAATYHS